MTRTTKLGGITCAVDECLTCGIPYTVPLMVWENNYKKGGTHYCPNGHGQGWSKNECEDAVIRRERDRLKQETARLSDEVKQQREQREAAECSAAAYKGQTTKLKKRAAAGVCPCCNRTFQNLARHMANKHPTFADDDKVVPLKTA